MRRIGCTKGLTQPGMNRDSSHCTRDRLIRPCSNLFLRDDVPTRLRRGLKRRYLERSAREVHARPCGLYLLQR